MTLSSLIPSPRPLLCSLLAVTCLPTSGQEVSAPNDSLLGFITKVKNAQFLGEGTQLCRGTRCISLLPLPSPVAHSAEPGKPLPEAVRLLTYAFLAHSNVAKCGAECTKHSLKLPSYRVLCLVVRIRCTFTGRKKPTSN